MTTPLQIEWAMPSRWTFQIKPIREWIGKYWTPDAVSVDPFAGTSELATYSNDWGRGGIDAEEWAQGLADRGIKADLIFWDPPYSPRQIAECYKGLGLKATMADTQNAALYSRVRKPLSQLAQGNRTTLLTFGWSTSGFGKEWVPIDVLIVRHGGAHNDTICTAHMLQSARMI